jgi:fumarylacetoacetate (FAA) hydrolase
LKLVTYSEKKTSKKTRAGLLWGEWIVGIDDLSRIAEKLEIKLPRSVRKVPDEIGTVQDVLLEGPKLLDDLQTVSWRLFNRIIPKEHRLLTRLENAKIRPPIPRPPSIRDFYAFEDHVKAARARRGLQMPAEWYEFPAFYYSNSNAVYGPDDEVPVPSYTKALDFELEVACVIGKAGRNISEPDAASHIAGYTLMNDWSARDVQEKEMKVGLGPAKAKDFATSLGPWLVTPDEMQDRQVAPGVFRLAMTAKVNGKLLSNGEMSKMHWTFPQMIARASQSVTLQPGDIIGSGTVGTGSILELGQEVHRWLLPSDVVELEVERLGVLRNRIVEQPN